MSANTLLDSFYAAIKAADAPALAQCVQPDFKLHWQGTPSIPWAGDWQGVDGLLAFFKLLDQHILVLDVQRLHTLSNDQVTVVVLKGRWKTRASGVELSAMAANVFEFADGKIRSYTVLNNTAAFAEALAAAN